jgi:hypothetical protein
MEIADVPLLILGCSYGLPQSLLMDRAVGTQIHLREVGKPCPGQPHPLVHRDVDEAVLPSAPRNPREIAAMADSPENFHRAVG